MRIAFRQLAPLLFGLAALAAAPAAAQRSHIGAHVGYDFDRDFAVASPMPEPESAAGGVYCEQGCHEIKAKYGTPKTKAGSARRLTRVEAAVHLK